MEEPAAQPHNSLSPLLQIPKKARSAGSPRQRQLRSSISFASAEFFLEDATNDNEPSHLDDLWPSHNLGSVQSSPSSYTACRVQLDPEEDLQDALDRDHTLNLLAWDVINREISEWQYVCVAGRPSWWSPVSRNHRHVQRDSVQTSDIYWDMQEIGGRTGTYPSERRRSSQSDGVLVNKVSLEELAHLIALQLLSACFTLPPENIAGSTPSAFRYYDTVISPDLPDPHLISSLRMHTHFRYTPSFGHDARNTSPAHSWPHSYDGTSQDDLSNLKVPPKASKSSSSSVSLLSSMNFKKTRRHVHRALQVTEESMASGSSDNQQFSATKIEPPQAESSTSWEKRKGVQDSLQKSIALPEVLTQGSSSSPVSPAKNEKMIDANVESLTSPIAPQVSPVSSVALHSINATYLESSSSSCATSPRRGVDIQRPRRSLRTIIRSDPHPVFVQPVKELVVRRWRKFRRRFRQPSNPTLSNPSEDFLGLATLPGRPEFSRRASSADVNSLVLSSSGRTRRRRARERGHVRSESWESSPRHTTPVHSGMASPEAGSGTISFTSEDADGFLSPSAVSEQRLSTSDTLQSPSQNIMEEKKDSAPPDAKSQNINQDPPSDAKSFRRRPEVKRSGRRSKSRMSEVFTAGEAPDIDADPYAIAAIGTVVQSTDVKFPAGVSLNILPASTDTLQVDMNDFPEDIGLNSRSTRLTEEDLAMQMADDLDERPVALHRTSTNGTQVWKPAAEGIEVDGLPVGPAMHENKWEGRREGSFL